MLEDVLPENPTMIFAGTAAGNRSAQTGAYYAHKGNRFWKTLADVGFTSRLFAPAEFRLLASLGLGLTDLCQTQSGMDKVIDRWDVGGFEQKILAAGPKAIAFTSKKAASIWSKASYGRSLQFGGFEHGRRGFPLVFVLPSTSGANGHWSIEPWQALHRWWIANR